jgi:hypothetical protein
LLFAFLGLAFASAGCGGSPTAPRSDEVFYLHTSGKIDKNESYEVYFKPLDGAETERLPKRVGVGILNGDARLGRPTDWYVRAADYTAERRYISYQSPRQFLFSIFERIDHPEDSWPEVLDRYEDDLEAQGAEILAARVPIATANTQGRSYLLKTKVAAKTAYQSYAHEILVRSKNRILLVQIVHGESIEASADEMAAALQSLIVY